MFPFCWRHWVSQSTYVLRCVPLFIQIWLEVGGDATKSNTRTENWGRNYIKRQKLFAICYNVLGDDIGNRHGLSLRAAGFTDPHQCLQQSLFLWVPAKNVISVCNGVLMQGLNVKCPQYKPPKRKYHDWDCISNKNYQPNFSTCRRACSDRGAVLETISRALHFACASSNSFFRSPKLVSMLLTAM